MFLPRDIDQACSDDDYPWARGDRTLYELCDEEPTHTDLQSVIAKVWLIGRAYAAAIERGRDKTTDTDTLTQLYEVTARSLMESDLDSHLNKLRCYVKIDHNNKRDVLSAHLHLLDVLLNVTRKRKRSFAAKYLHFHCPSVVPIYDSYAEGTLRKLVPTPSLIPKNYDHAYADFVERFIILREQLSHQYGRVLTPRQLDRLLWLKGEKYAYKTMA
jgi:hypothetical protein